MLSVNPKMLPRLYEIEEDLLDRRKRADTEGWQGEIEGIDLTLPPARPPDRAAMTTAPSPWSR
jgi:hypothetical protein